MVIATNLYAARLGVFELYWNYIEFVSQVSSESSFKARITSREHSNELTKTLTLGGDRFLQES